MKKCPPDTSETPAKLLANRSGPSYGKCSESLAFGGGALGD